MFFNRQQVTNELVQQSSNNFMNIMRLFPVGRFPFEALWTAPEWNVSDFARERRHICKYDL